jgi:hypothetical protein
MEVARRQYEVGKTQACYRRLLQMLRKDPTVWLRNSYFINAVFADVGRLDELNALLDEALKSYPGINFSSSGYDPQLIDAMRRQRHEARKRDIPPLLVICQHKSGSEAIHTRLVEEFAVPTMRISLQTMPLDHVIQSWASDFAEGGCLGGPHLNATPENCAKLERAGIRKLVVHVRDPRQSLLSQTHYVRTVRESSGDERLIYREFLDQAKPLSECIDECLDRYLGVTIDWISGWIAAAEKFEILFTTYEQFRFDSTQFYNDMTSFLGLPPLRLRDSELVGHHFRSGRSSEWLEVFTPEQRERCAAQIPTAMMRRFHWSREAQWSSLGDYAA